MPNAVTSFLRSFLTTNKGLKALSLFVAVVVWYGIRGAISFEAVLEDLPVEILHDEGWAVHEGADQTVDVRFRGSRADVRDMTRDQVSVTIDARGDPQRGVRTVSLVPRNVRAPTGARPFLFRPEQVQFSLDRESERRVPVRSDVQGQVPDGFEIDDVICTPDTVLVRAPSAQLEGVEFVRTTPIELDGRIQSFRIRKTLVPPGGARLDPERVQVEVLIREHASSRDMASVPVHVLMPPGVQAPVLEPGSVIVEVQGRPEVLRGLDPGAIRAYVEMRGSGDPAGLHPVLVHVPAGIRVVRVVPDAVTGRVQPEE